MKIVTIIGARPQFIKAAVISRVFAQSLKVKEVIVHTGQHYDANMSDVFFEEMAIPKPHYNLAINGLGHGAMTGQMLEKIEQVLLVEKPDWVLVYGDTNSTIAGALAAKKLHIKIAHVEAGLRSFNMDMPEEINRILTDRISDILFCPTDRAIENLKMEGYGHLTCQIIKNGDVMLDAAMFYSDKAKRPACFVPEKFILVTVHRPHNTDTPGNLKDIFSALEIISVKYPVVLPLHPRTKAKLKLINYDFEHSRINFIDPVGYLEMIWLIKHCELVMTDSGGLQKESYFFGKYCVTLKGDTEWVELVDQGFNILAGGSVEDILKGVELAMTKDKTKFAEQLCWFGNGHAGECVLEVMNKQV